MKQSHLIFVISGWIIVILLSWIWNINSIRKKTLDLVENKAQAFFNEVEITRLWNAQHGGVYVPVTEEIRPNQYLNVPNRDITTTTGIELTLVNPAFMTRQISELAMTNSYIQYHITSLKPIRPANKADNWETNALKSFESGTVKALELIDTDTAKVYRYMAPLMMNGEPSNVFEPVQVLSKGSRFVPPPLTVDDSNLQAPPPGAEGSKMKFPIATP